MQQWEQSRRYPSHNQFLGLPGCPQQTAASPCCSVGAGSQQHRPHRSHAASPPPSPRAHSHLQQEQGARDPHGARSEVTQ